MKTLITIDDFFDLYYKIQIKGLNIITDRLGFNTKSRVKNVAMARQIIMFISRELTELPLAQIGSQIGGRDHSTIIHGCKSIENIIKNDLRLNKNINTFIDELSTKKYPV